MDDEVRVQVNDDIEKIMVRNLDEKVEVFIKKLESCEGCPNFDEPYIHGGVLYCCSFDYENSPTRTSRDKGVLFEDCPMGKEITLRKSFIKQYGIIHNKPRSNSYGGYRGSLSVVDFSGTTFEWDGYNPDVDWEPLVVFYYNNQEEANVMMELALDYYYRFNLDAPFVEKHCYG